jgi:hypothetical protein
MISFKKELLGEISFLMDDIVDGNSIIFYHHLEKYENDDYIHKEALCHLYTPDISLYLSLDYDINILKHLYKKIKNEGIKGVCDGFVEYRNIVHNYENSIYDIEINRSSILVDRGDDNILSIEYKCSVYKALKILKTILKNREKILNNATQNYEKLLSYLPYIRRNFLYKGYNLNCDGIDKFSIELFLKKDDIIIDDKSFCLSFEYIFSKYKEFNTMVRLYFEESRNYISLFDFDLNILKDILEIIKKMENLESNVIRYNGNEYEIYFIPDSFLNEINIWNNNKIIAKLLFGKSKKDLKDLIDIMEFIFDNKEKFSYIYEKSTIIVFDLLEKSIKRFLENNKQS